jgi:hypothetical protein
MMRTLAGCLTAAIVAGVFLVTSPRPAQAAVIFGVPYEKCLVYGYDGYNVLYLHNSCSYEIEVEVCYRDESWCSTPFFVYHGSEWLGRYSQDNHTAIPRQYIDAHGGIWTYVCPAVYEPVDRYGRTFRRALDGDYWCTNT